MCKRKLNIMYSSKSAKEEEEEEEEEEEINDLWFSGKEKHLVH